jgi:hypothetical protein
MGEQATARSGDTGETVSDTVKGNNVYRSDGKKVGEIERHMIDKISDEIVAGLLVYRVIGTPEILLTHPGGPYWSRNDEGSWSIPTWPIPKSVAEADDVVSRARREFANDTGHLVSTPAPRQLTLV